MNKPLLSIIVPVYNVEKYLGECLDSLVYQTSKSYEIILIDDGSIDSSPAICDRYADSFSYIKVFHIANGGVSNARNKGLEIASGKYITFVDSDDYVSNNFVETLLREMSNSDLLMYSHIVFDSEGALQYKGLDSRRIETKINIEKYLYQLKVDYIKEWEFFGYIWNKCYRKEIIDKNNIRFKEGLSCREDNLFNESYYRNMQTWSVIKEPLYNYRVAKKSLTHKKKTQWDYQMISRELEKVTNNITYQPLLLCDKKRIFEFYQMTLFPHDFFSHYKEVRSWVHNHSFLPMNIFQTVSFKDSSLLCPVSCYMIYGIKYCYDKVYSFLSLIKHTLF